MNEDTQKKQNQHNAATNLGYAVGGFVAGAATASAVSASARNQKGEQSDDDVENVVIDTECQDEEEEVVVTVEEPQHIQQETPAVVVETSLYAPIAHVSDDLTFSQAFAEARRQVGPGGVFEWRGNVYGTYYAEEWEKMSAAERAEYHAHIDYQAAHDEHVAYFGNEPRHNPQPTPNTDDSKVKPNETKIDIDPEEPVKVLTIQQVDCEYGEDGKAIIAEITIDGQPAILFDLNNDGHFDALIMDLNNDGRLDDNEIVDIADWHIELVDLADKYNGEIQVVVNGEVYTGGGETIIDIPEVVITDGDYHNDEFIG